MVVSSHLKSLRLIFDHAHQVDLASCLQDMLKERENILERHHHTSHCAEWKNEEHEDWEESRHMDSFDSEGSIISDSVRSDSTVDQELEWFEVTGLELSSLGFIELSH